MGKNKNRSLGHPIQHHQIASRTETSIVQRQYCGPIPPSTEMRAYEEILPGSADRILKMAEQQSVHRQSLETAVIKGNLHIQKAGLVVGTIITIAAIFSGTFLILNDKQWMGLVTILSMISLDTGVFIFGKLRQEKERTKKNEEAITPRTDKAHIA